MIKGLHHTAYRCQDSEVTRQFYEDFLGLRLVGALPISKAKATTDPDSPAKLMHCFFQIDDSAYLVFFEVPDWPFDMTRPHDYDPHIALEVEAEALEAMRAKAKAENRDVSPIADHGFIRSIYLRDPNGYVIELTAKMPNHDALMDPSGAKPRQVLRRWQSAKKGRQG